MINESLYHKLDYTFKNEKTIISNGNEYIRSQQNKGTTSAISQSLIYKKSNHNVFLISGHYFRFSQTFAGIGGDNKFLKHDFEIKYFTLSRIEEFNTKKFVLPNSLQKIIGLILIVKMAYYK